MDGTVPDHEIKRMIAESYDLVTASPSKRIYEAVQKIPRGKVATYGQIAELAGDKKMARAVGNALHKNPDPDGIPCYRVVNAKGELSGEFAFGGAGAQAKLLSKRPEMTIRTQSPLLLSSMQFSLFSRRFKFVSLFIIPESQTFTPQQDTKRENRKAFILLEKRIN